MTHRDHTRRSDIMSGFEGKLDAKRGIADIERLRLTNFDI
jgi:hypothetical protein